jgi:hypothetical protein
LEHQAAVLLPLKMQLLAVDDCQEAAPVLRLVVLELASLPLVLPTA